MRPEQIKCPFIVILSLEMQEVVLPQRFIITIGNERNLIEGVKEIHISWILHKVDIASPYFYVSAVRLVFVQRSELH